jgi:hypothetical protein
LGIEAPLLVALWQMTEGTSSGEENANLYMRGVNEGRGGELLDGEELLPILEVFGEDGLRSYILGHLEGIADLEERDAADEEGEEESEPF